MLKIAICDDNISDLSNIVSILDDYKSLHRDKRIVEYTAFHSAMDLITSMENGQQYELLLLDILMPFITGMDTAREIRQFNQDVKIIFTTSSTEFAVESYSVGGYYYALKPIWKEKLFILLDKVIYEKEIQTDTSILIKSTSGLTRVYINRLEFAEVMGRIIFFHLTDGSVIEASGSMFKLEKTLLSKENFIKPHRSFIVNMAHINTLSQREIKMQSLAIVPIAKANYSIVKSTYISFAFNELKN